MIFEIPHLIAGLGYAIVAIAGWVKIIRDARKYKREDLEVDWEVFNKAQREVNKSK